MAQAPGKTAPRLLEDLLNYDPRYEHDRNLIADPPPQFDPATTVPPRFKPPRSCRHALTAKDAQCKFLQPGESPNASSTYRIAALCSQCRFHFDIFVGYEDYAYFSPCPNDEYPLHHFILQNRTTKPNPSGIPEESEYIFTCTSRECPVNVRIRVRPPVFKTAWVSLVTNPANLTSRLNAAIQNSPDRPDLKAAKPIEGLNFLARYLKDSLTTEMNQKKIPMRNRKFMVTYGNDCEEIFEDLGFTKFIGEDVHDSAWCLPQAGPEIDPLGERTHRCKIEDVIAELNALILKRPSSEQKLIQNLPTQPLPCLQAIERALGCLDYKKTPSARRNTQEDLPEHPYYAALGVLSDFSDSLVMFGYDRQAECDPANRPYYFECIQDLAKGRESEDMLLKATLLESGGQPTRKQVREAYMYFNIDPTMPYCSDDFVLNQFRVRFQDVSKSQANDMREQLRILGEARQSGKILQVANDALETYVQALEYLEVEQDTTDDYIVTMIQFKNDSDKAKVRKAVSIVAKHRQSNTLNNWLVGKTDTGMDLADAHRALGLDDRTQKLDQGQLLAVYQTRLDDRTGPTTELDNAYAMLSKHWHGSPDDDAPETASHPIDQWPVGFQNIGNTCYLNSLLQYFFTIKPLREFVLDFEQNKLDPATLTSSERRVGGALVTIDEVEKAQEFLLELSRLFNEMIRTTERSVRPKVELAVLALQKKAVALDKVEGNTAVESTADTATITPSTQVTSSEKPEAAPTTHTQLETGDVGSDGTLVEDSPTLGPNNDPRPEPGQDSATPDPNSKAQQKSLDDETLPDQPSRPPPIPPRPVPTVPMQQTVPREIEESAKQQDVAEVMNRILDKLQCAVKPTMLPNGELNYLARKLFFGETTSTRSDNEGTTKEKAAWDSLFVRVNEGPRDIYTALDDEFDKGEIEASAEQNPTQGTKTSYETISVLPPVVGITVKRVYFDKKKKESVKSQDPLGLADILYFDRYLEQTRSISAEDLFKLRQKSWEFKRWMRVLRTRQNELLTGGVEDTPLADSLEVTTDYLLEKPERTAEDEALSVKLRNRVAELREELKVNHVKLQHLQSKNDALFQGLTDQPYRLHAVFMHRGGAAGGHYWVYIRDFQTGVWRKYNDRVVTEVLDTKEIFEGAPGETSTGVMYVRDDQKEAITEALCRHVAPKGGSQEDFEMLDAEVIEGVEV